jgi:hypothetical protein
MILSAFQMTWVEDTSPASVVTYHSAGLCQSVRPHILLGWRPQGEFSRAWRPGEVDTATSGVEYIRCMVHGGCCLSHGTNSIYRFHGNRLQ